MVENDDATSLPLGILPVARNVKFHLTSCRTRDGIQSKYGFVLPSKRAVTGLAALKVGAGVAFTPITVANVGFDVTNNVLTVTTATPHGLAAGSPVVLKGTLVNSFPQYTYDTASGDTSGPVLAVLSPTVYTVATNHNDAHGVSAAFPAGTLMGTSSGTTVPASDLQVPIAFDSAGNLVQETPVGTGKTAAITSDQVKPPSSASMQVAAAYKRGYLAFGNLQGASLGKSAVFSPVTGKLDPLGQRPVGEPWQPNTDYQVGEVVTPSAVGGNGHSFRCILAHTSGAAEPIWPLTEGATVGAWQETTPVMAQVVPIPTAPTAIHSVGPGTFAAARDVYIRVTLLNGIGETLPSLPYVFLNTAGTDRFAVQSPTLPAWVQELTGSAAVTGYNVYEADVANGAAAPATAAYKLVNVAPIAIGTGENVDSAGIGAAPPLDNSAVVVPVGNVAAGIRHAVVLFVNRNGNISGMSQAASVATSIQPVTTTTETFGISTSQVEDEVANPAQQNQVAGAAWEYLVFGSPQWRTVGPNPPIGDLPYMYAHNFGLAIPADAIITGIAVRFLAAAQSVTTSYVDHVALFSAAAAVGTVKNPGPADVISTSAGWHGLYGGSSDAWGLDPATLTPAMVNDPTFGFGVQLNYTSNAAGQRLFLFNFEITVFYAAQPTLASAANTYRLLVSHIPIGPENTIARIVAFTPAGDLDQIAGTGVTSAGPYFWIAPAFPDGRFDLSKIAGGVTLADVIDSVQMTSTLINDNTSDSAIFNFTDDYLKLTLNDVSDYFRKIFIPPASDIYYSKNLKRMFFKTDILPSGWYVSLLDDPESVYGDTGLIEVAENNGENGVCIRDYGTQTYALKERSGHLVNPSPEDPAKWEIVEQWTGSGPAGPRAVDVCTNFLCYAGRQGVWVFFSGKPQWISRELPISWAKINWAYRHTIWVLIDEDTREIRIGVPYGQATAPSIILKCNYEQSPDFQPPIHFSPYIGKEIATGNCYKWSIDDIAANLAIRAQRTLAKPPQFIDAQTVESQILYASSNDDGAVCAEVPYLFNDNGVGIDSIIETACPQIVNQAGQTVKSLFGPAMLGGVQANVDGQGKFSVEVIGLRGKHPENGGPLTANIYAFAKTIGAVVRLKEGTAGIPYSSGGRMRNERMRLRITNNKTPDSWFDIKFAALQARPESTARPG